MSRKPAPLGDEVTIRVESLPVEVAAVIATWLPRSVRDADRAALAAVMPEVREFVAAMAPQTPRAARHLFWALAPMAVAMYRRLGVFGAATVNHNNVEIWVSHINANRKRSWRVTARSTLRKIGRAVNPLGWPQPPKGMSRIPAVNGYPSVEELLFIDAAALPGFENPAQRRWVTAGALGAGLNGPELATADISDLHELGNGRLAIRVRGRNPRLVPIRGCCTDLVRQAVDLVQQRPPQSHRRFVLANDKNAGARLANKVAIGRDRRLSLPRARSTWLTAHLRADTPLVALNEIAEPLSAETLKSLIAASGITISAEQAALKGLGA